MPRYSHDHLRNDVNATFDIARLAAERSPLNVGDFTPDSFPNIRVNHYLIKSNEGVEWNLGEADHTAVEKLVDKVLDITRNLHVATDDRYCFLTIDQGIVAPDRTLRDPGWHIDGMQGDEVPIKKPGDLQFVWSDHVPTSFAVQEFDVDGLDPSVHNVFDWVGRQVDPDSVIQSEPGTLYAISPYHVHRGTPAKERVYRRFARLSFTYTPVTSTRMTINPTALYNYPYHTTTGAIPDHLRSPSSVSKS